MAAKERLNSPSTLRREPHDAAAAVGGVVSAGYPAATFEPVDCSGHRSAGEQDLFSQCLNRQRAFVKQCFEHSEVALAQAEGRDAAPGLGLHRPEGLPQHQPQVNTACVRIERPLHKYLDIKMLDSEKRIQAKCARSALSRYR